MNGSKLEQFKGPMDVGLTQWIARKLKNHDPSAKMDDGKPAITKQAQQPQMVTKLPVSERIVNHAGSTEVVYQTNTGKRFLITVAEIA